MSTEKLNEIETTVVNIRTRLNRGNRMSIILGVILLALMAAYFIYGYREIDSVLKPGIIADLGQTMLNDHIPGFRQSIQSEVERNAPLWAESLSTQAVDSLPQVREALVKHTIDQTDLLVTQTISLSEANFNDFLEKNRSDVQQAIDELKQNEDVSTELLTVFEQGLSDVLQADFERDSQEILAYSRLMEEKMTRLFAGTNLDPGERLERQALMVLRRLQLSELKD